MKKSVRISIRLTEHEHQNLRKYAAMANLNLSDYCRELLIVGENPEDIICRQMLFGEISNVRYEINKIGTNINQVARVCNSKKFASHNDVDEIKKYQKAILHILQELKKSMEVSLNGK